MNEKKHLIWTSLVSDEDIREGIAMLKECNPHLVGLISEGTWNDWAWENQMSLLDDEKLNLSHIEIPNGIIVIAKLGLWNKSPWAVLPKEKVPKTVSDCLQSYIKGCSDVEFYVDEQGEFRGEESHHDGCNSYLFRAYREDVTDEEKEDLEYRIYCQKDFQDLLERLTFRLGDLIGDVYGWDFSDRPIKSQNCVKR